MNDTLTDHLRTAFQHRAHEIADAEPPGLLLGYTSPTPRPAHVRRRWPALAGGAVAAGLLTVAMVTGGSDAPPTSSRLTQTTSAEPAAADELRTITSGEVAGRPWRLVVVRHQGGELVQLRADGIEPSGGIVAQEVPVDMDAVSSAVRSDAWQLPGGHELVVAVVTPDIEGITAEGTPTVTAEAVVDPAHPEGWRYAVLELAPGAEHVRIRFHRTGGGEADPVELDVSAPVAG